MQAHQVSPRPVEGQGVKEHLEALPDAAPRRVWAGQGC